MIRMSGGEIFRQVSDLEHANGPLGWFPVSDQCGSSRDRRNASLSLADPMMAEGEGSSAQPADLRQPFGECVQRG